MKIHKIDLHGKSTKAAIPAGSKILKSGVQVREGKPVTVVWFLAPEGEPIPVKFANVPTGGDAPAGYTYIGTTQVMGPAGEEVRHQFVESNAAVSLAR